MEYIWQPEDEDVHDAHEDAIEEAEAHPLQEDGDNRLTRLV